MAHFLKTVTATFAAGLICGAAALVALAPEPASEVSQAGKAGANPQKTGANTQPDKAQVAVVSPTSVPCKDQVWPAIDRRCMRWTAEGWTGTAAEPAGKAAEPAAPAKSAAPAAAQPKPQTPPAAEPRTAAAKPGAPIEAPKQTAPQQPATPAAPQQAATPAAPQPAQAEAQPTEPPAATAATAQPTANIAADESAAAKSVHAEKARKPHRTRVARSREHERDYYGRRVARAWGDDSSEVVTRRYIVRQASPFFLFGGN